MPPKLLPLYSQVAGRIAEMIDAGTFAPGERIYSIRQICENFDVADVTAKKAITQLRHRGLIRTVNGSGAFVTQADDEDQTAQTSSSENRVVGFIKIGIHPAPIFAYEIDLLQHELAKLDHTMIYSIAQNDHELDAIAQRLKQAKPCCLLAFPPHRTDYDLAGQLAKLRSCGVPILTVESRLPSDSYITTDTERATMTLADYLHDLGHRNICLATTFKRKVSGFESALKRWKDPSVNHCILGEAGKTNLDTKLLAEKILALSPRPTAVIAADDHAAAVMVSCFIQHGVSVPEQISVVTFGDHPRMTSLSPVPMTVIRHPYLEIAQEAAQWAHDQYENPSSSKPLRREMTGTLIVRDSSGPPPLG